MKVVIAGSYPYRDNKISGGVQSVLYNLNKSLLSYSSNLELEVLSSSNLSISLYEKYNNIIYINKPKIKIISYDFSSWPSRIRKIQKTMKCDIFNAHIIPYAYFWIKDRTNENLVYTLHGITFQEKKSYNKLKKTGWYLIYTRKLNYILKNINYFISINPYVTSLISERTNAKIFEIDNPVPIEYFSIKDRHIERRILYLGGINPDKNIHTLIKSLKILKDKYKNIKLIIAGKIEDNCYYNNISEYINKHDLKNNIEFKGVISGIEKIEELSKMNFLILPSHQETSPMSISESFSVKKPVIASNITGIPYMIDNGKNGLLINQNNEFDIEEKISYFLDNQSEIVKMGRNAYDFALNHNHPEIVAKKYIDCYKKVLN